MKLFQVDAFTLKPFTGNPAGVCLLDKEIPVEHMQQIAAEIKCSETAFVLKRGSRYGIRYFTPVVEVELCGHATLASAHILWEQKWVGPAEKIIFKAHRETIEVTFDNVYIAMSFPKDTLAKPQWSIDAASFLGLESGVVNVMQSRFGWTLVEVTSEELVRAATPDFGLLALHKRSILITARSQDNVCDFVSRFFAPHIGIDEDPVTGFAHTTLGEYWAPIIEKSELKGRQVSSRMGDVRVTVGAERNTISGQAVTMFELVFCNAD